MANAWALSALWVGLALIATLLAIWFRVATALSEIIVGTVAQLIIGAFLGSGGLLSSTQWVTYLAGTGAIVLTFLAGAELEPAIFQTKWREALLVGMAGFVGPFLGCTLVGHYVLGWSMRSSWLCGVALSTTSVAVVYAVMLELGFNVTDYGKVDPRRLLCQRPWHRHRPGIDLFAIYPQDTHFCRHLRRSLCFPARSHRAGSSGNTVAASPSSKPSTSCSSSSHSGGLAVWAGSEAVLPAYMIGAVLAGTVGKDHFARPPPAHSHLRVAHALLFHSRRLLCLRARCSSPLQPPC